MAPPRTRHGLRLLVYDDNCRRRGLLPWLSFSWMLGGRLFQLLGRIDHVRGVRTWREALSWLARVSPEREIAEIQFWGHGRWGRVLVGPEAVHAGSVRPGNVLHPWLDAVRRRMAGPQALWWFRSCEVFGARAGHEFARAWTRFFGCRAASYTYIVAFWQSGLHVLEPGAEPDWPLVEGLAEGTADAPAKAKWSGRKEPATMTCLSLSGPFRV